MATKKLTLNEVRGTMSGGNFGKRLGFRVLKVLNTTDQRIGQFLTATQLDDLIQFGHYTTETIGFEHADKGEDI